MSSKTSQIFLYILIPNAVYHLAFPAIEDELSGDWAVAVLGLGAFLLVDQVAVLLLDSFFVTDPACKAEICCSSSAARVCISDKSIAHLL